MEIARRTLFQGVCASLLGRVLPEDVAEPIAAKGARTVVRIRPVRDRVFRRFRDSLLGGYHLFENIEDIVEAGKGLFDP